MLGVGDDTDWEPNTQQQFELCAAAEERYAQQHEFIAEPISVIFLLSITHSIPRKNIKINLIHKSLHDNVQNQQLLRRFSHAFPETFTASSVGALPKQF